MTGGLRSHTLARPPQHKSQHTAMCGTMRVVCALVVAAFVLAGVDACTNYLITKGATVDGSTQISYAADSGSLYGSLGHYAAKIHANGSTREVWDWDSGVFMGEITEASETYNVVGNMNEHQLAIGETTFGGLEQLGHQPGAIIDYGSLIWITLQRTKTAREAIQFMGSLVAEYGYASEGESFSIADPNEVWVLEMIGKGPGEKGAVWVAMRIPDGYVSGHANQARIQTFPRDDPDNCMFSKDVVSFAVTKGLYPASAKPEDFSFSDTYDPVGFTGARFCEVRVWAFFRQVNASMESHLDYVQGYNLKNRMPLYVKPAKKIALNDTFWYMRTHFEGTWFQNYGVERADVGAGAFHSPYRWRPLEWQSGGKTYVNERTVGTQQTAWHFVAQMRSWIPDPVGGLFWFAVDDTAHSVHFPMYATATSVPAAFGDRYGQEPAAAVKYGVDGDGLNFSFDSAWWVFNLVANYAYSRYSDVNADVAANIVAIEKQFIEEVVGIDEAAMAIAKDSREDAIAFLTKYSADTGNTLVKTWLSFFTKLFTTYRDGFRNTETSVPVCKPGQRENCTFRPIPSSKETGYDKAWYARIVSENGEHYHVPAQQQEHDRRKLRLV
eukprot:m.108942 g.108942  ORF g.108942 m.108942 type:complete len:610 (+) comp15944_c1_seq2:50-1879(+)